MARKWSNVNLPGALHFVTGNCLDRMRVFSEAACCNTFIEGLRSINRKWPSKLIAYVLMPDHFHLISNPRDGRIKEFIGELKSLSAKKIVEVTREKITVTMERGIMFGRKASRTPHCGAAG